MRISDFGFRNDRGAATPYVEPAAAGAAPQSKTPATAGKLHPKSKIQGFTLVELLVVVTIIAVLVSILGITLRKVRHATQSYTCKNKLKTVAFEFSLFADDYWHSGRGDSDKLRGKGFYVRDFQDKLYRVDEFWELGNTQTLAYAPSRTALMCPIGPQQLEAQAGFPCDSAVNPKANVSMAFNKRLERASVQQVGTGWWILADVRLNSRILERPWTPLAFDGDGADAVKRSRPLRSGLPFYMAPPAGDPGQYGNGQFWFPAMRHEREINACFVGGHVLASRQPLEDPAWDWSYQPPPEE